MAPHAEALQCSLAPTLLGIKKPQDTPWDVNIPSVVKPAQKATYAYT